LDEGYEPILGRFRFLPFLPHRAEFGDALRNDRLADLGLGLEVIIDIAQGDFRLARISASAVFPKPRW